jgi:LAO/AO transport system kinase
MQAIKRGIMEVADILLITKADGDLSLPAKKTLAQYRSVLHLLRPRSPLWVPPVLACSALTGENIPLVWDTMIRFRDLMRVSLSTSHFGHLHKGNQEHSELEQRRKAQRKTWLWKIVTEELLRGYVCLVCFSFCLQKGLSECIKTNKCNKRLRQQRSGQCQVLVQWLMLL